MTISWHGEYTIKIISKGIVLAVNPHSQNGGLPSFRAKADIVVLTNPSNQEMSYLSGIQGSPVILDQPGEYSLSGMTFYGRGWHDSLNNEQTIYRWNIEGMTMLYLGSLNRKLEPVELQELEKTNIDVLFVPVGGLLSLDAAQAVEIVSTIEPHIVIPMNFKAPGSSEKIDPVDKFASEMGISARGREDKLTITPNKINREIVTTVILTN